LEKALEVYPGRVENGEKNLVTALG
jgi:hypothetical protein